MTSVIATGIAGEQLRRSLRTRSRQDSAEVTLEQRLEALARTMRQSSRLLEQVTAELEVRATAAERLRRDAATAEQVAKLNQAERDAVAHLLRAELTTEARRSTRVAILTGLLFFVGGVAATVGVTLFVQPLYR